MRTLTSATSSTMDWLPIRGCPPPSFAIISAAKTPRGRYAPGTEFQIGKIEMVTNTGTYVDCPFHRYEDGKDLSQVALDSFVDLDGIVIRADYRKGLAVTAEAFKGKELLGRAVLVHTGWDEYWATSNYYENHPFLTEDAAIYLKQCGVKLVGINSMNIDDTRGNARPVHSTLLREEILIAEHLCNLANVPDEGFSFTAVPPKIEGAGTFPVRAFAKLK